MKTIVGKVCLVAAVTSVTTPFVSVAQNIASQPGTVNRSVERLTLLTGPNLLSPAQGAPQSTSRITIVPASIKVGSRPSFHLVFDGPSQSGQPPQFSESIRSHPPATVPKGSPSLSPESLRFESAVTPTPVSLPTETKPAPKRD